MDINVKIVEIRECISQVYISRDYDEDNINEWLPMDTNDPGYNTLSEDEIVHILIEEGDSEGEENKTDVYLTKGEYGPIHSEYLVRWI